MPPLPQKVLDRIAAAAKRRRKKLLAQYVRGLREAADVGTRQRRLLAITDEEWQAAQRRDDERAREEQHDELPTD